MTSTNGSGAGAASLVPDSPIEAATAATRDLIVYLHVPERATRHKPRHRVRAPTTPRRRRTAPTAALPPTGPPATTPASRWVRRTPARPDAALRPSARRR